MYSALMLDNIKTNKAYMIRLNQTNPMTLQTLYYFLCHQSNNHFVCLTESGVQKLYIIYNEIVNYYLLIIIKMAIKP